MKSETPAKSITKGIRLIVNNKYDIIPFTTNKAILILRKLIIAFLKKKQYPNKDIK